jgi:hypothetical protein
VLQVRRLMEEDNRKRRKAARKDFQDGARDLAAFVRKRDPRVSAWRAADDARRAERAAADERRRARFAALHACSVLLCMHCMHCIVCVIAGMMHVGVRAM